MNLNSLTESLLSYYTSSGLLVGQLHLDFKVCGDVWWHCDVEYVVMLLLIYVINTFCPSFLFDKLMLFC